jgi:hypothetical protein
LLTIGIIPLTQGSYRALSDRSSRWKESGIIPIDCFAAHGRSIRQDFNDIFETVDEYLDKAFNYLRDAQHDYAIPMWYKQPKACRNMVRKRSASRIL